ncbi:hypothetical protein AZA_90575 [Nitrospirillum viridazoti Y2]|nr:hypothetical protein AZA_90575 [Nitrospirillum amazonense Y2]
MIAWTGTGRWPTPCCGACMAAPQGRTTGWARCVRPLPKRRRIDRWPWPIWMRAAWRSPIGSSARTSWAIASMSTASPARWRACASGWFIWRIWA